MSHGTKIKIIIKTKFYLQKNHLFIFSHFTLCTGGWNYGVGNNDAILELCFKTDWKKQCSLGGLNELRKYFDQKSFSSPILLFHITCSIASRTSERCGSLPIRNSAGDFAAKLGS